MPFGSDWVSRFQACWERALTKNIVTQSSIWPQYETDHFSGNIAMGKAILQADQLSVEALQLLIWDEKQGDKGTARNASDWIEAGRGQIVLPYPDSRTTTSKAKKAVNVAIQASLFDQKTDTALLFPDIYAAVQKAFELQRDNKHQSRVGLHIDILPKGEVSSETAQLLANNAVPGGVLISESVVSILLLKHADEFTMDYLGRLAGGEDGIRAFALKRKG